MPDPGRPVTILMADDDEDDRLLTQEALRTARLANPLKFAHNGEDLLDYLRREGGYADPAVDAPRPGLILLDLNMPRMDGREALAAIKGDADLRRIPVIILTTSKADEDILKTYDLGANSFITKPVTFEGLCEVLRTWTQYWLEIVELPSAHGDGQR